MKKKKNTKKIWKGIGIGFLAILLVTILFVFFTTHIAIGKDFVRSKRRLDLNDYRLVSSYSEYEKLGLDAKLKADDFEKYNYVAFNTQNRYIYRREFNFVPTGYSLNNDTLTINITYASRCNDDILTAILYSFVGLNPRTYLLKLDKNVKINKIESNYINKRKRTCSYEKGDSVGVEKPLIYIYPNNDMNVKVKLGYQENLTATYPQYNDGWNVYAKTDGTLIDSDGKEYYGLYWEGVRKEEIEFNNGFVVSKEDLIPFLEEKLTILGLNARESNEFIIYWLPRLQKNKYNLFRFATKEEIEKEMPLNITPEPETLIRVFMEFKVVDKKVTINEQELNKVERNGYTVVEWGGSEQKSKK